MLNMLRKRAQSFVIQIIVLLIAIVFIFWGVGSNMNNNRNAAATVNDVEIPFQEFQRSYERAADNYRAQFGGQLPEGFLDNIGLKNQILNQLIQAELLRQGAEELGMVVSREETQRKILEMEAFKKNGQFDETQYKEILSQNRLNPTSFEAGLNSDLITTRMIDLIGSFSSVSDDEVQAWIEYGDTEIKLNYAEFTGIENKDELQVEDEELTAWFEQNQQEYITDPEVQLEYLYFRFADDLDQVELEEGSIEEYYTSNIERYTFAEERRARHILFKASRDDSEELRAQKKAEAERVLQLLNDGGDFVALATQYSEGPTKSSGGDLGFFSRGRMVPEFDQAVFSMGQGEVSGIVETDFGYHIILLEEIKPERVSSLDEVRSGIEQQLKQAGVKSITFQNASNAFEAIINAGSLASYVEQGGKVETTGFFTRNDPPAQLKQAGELLDSVFSLAKGELSSLIETSDGYAIAFVKDVAQPEVPELDQIRDKVAADYIEQKRIEEAEKMAEQLLEKARENGQLAGENIIETGFLKRQEASEEVPQELVQAAFELMGESSLPEEVLQIGDSFYIFQIIDSRVGETSITEQQRDAFTTQLAESEKQRLVSYFVAQMRENAEIWIHEQVIQ